MVGPCANQGDPVDTLNVVLLLLLGSSVHTADHYSTVCEGQYLHVGLGSAGTACTLVALWSCTDPLGRSPH